MDNSDTRPPLPHLPAPGGALVTGAARRIGRVIAIDLARRGWKVAVHHNSSQNDAQQVVAEIRSGGGTACAIQADLASAAEAAALMGRAIDAVGPIGCLVNNAAVFYRDDIKTMNLDSWDHHMSVNLRAPLILTQEIVRNLAENTSASVINILDNRVINLTPFFISYTASKSALWTLTRTLALALAPQIRVNAIGPGPTLRNDRQSEAHFVAQTDGVPLRRGATPEEVAGAVAFILSSPAMTGQMIALDGGEHLGWAHPNRRYSAQ